MQALIAKQMRSTPAQLDDLRFKVDIIHKRFNQLFGFDFHLAAKSITPKRKPRKKSTDSD